MKKEIRMKIGLRVKLTGIFLIFGAVILCVTIYMMSILLTRIYIRHYGEILTDAVEMTEEYLKCLGIETEDIHAYVRERSVDERYEDALQKMWEMQTKFDLESLYIIYPTGKETAVWFADASAQGACKFGEAVDTYAWDESRRVREVYETGNQIEGLDRTDLAGGIRVLSVYYPIRDSRGNSVAVIGADKSMDKLLDDIAGSIGNVIVVVFPTIAAAVTLLIVFVQLHLVRPIRRLKRSVLKLGEGVAEERVSSRRRDELGEIMRAFDRMAGDIGRHMEEMEELNSAYQKLLPSGLFDLLHKKSIADFHLGDQAHISLTVLSMEPQSAGGRLPKLSSGQTFGYINDMLAQTVPAVIDRGGAVWNFDRAAVCSFFQHSAKDALEAALLAGNSLNQKGERIAAGIMRGAVMVGIAGHEARMNVISISEQTRIAAFFMQIGERYHALVLIGKSAASQIEQFEDRYHVRFLGYLKLSAPERLEGVYDVFDGDEEVRRRQKQRTKESFERGVLLFTRQNYRGARDEFIDVLRQYRADAAAREYLGLCNRILAGEESGNRVWFEEL